MNNKIVILFCALAALLCVSFAISLSSGSSSMTPGRLIAALSNPSGTGTDSVIIWRVRFPRVALAMLTGMGLAVCGAVFQGLLRNPLADPYTLGISGGAALGAAIAIVSGANSAGALTLPLAAFGGSIFSVALIYFISSRHNFSTHTLVLAGVIVGFICSSLVLFIFAVTDASKLQAAIVWLMGDLSTASSRLIVTAGAAISAGTALLWMFRQQLNILTLGDEKAAHLGINTALVKKIIFLAASLITGATVSAAGVIGFVGLILPHAVRRLAGPDHRVLIPASALAGAIFLPLCDTAARTLFAPAELPVGVITGFIGGIFFLLLLLRKP
ncbi:MAG: hypothetical protein A2219_02265 [Elusimicrobia bacterium RIFOXYA2_FULL_50_26]|nr:MAG: hypothetical protein A2219_02265 [Elusimicrobia bacterium RIFOXYA2_FULL_50_26]OGS24081.1 MAG: hypothetical protein A2314_07135 [Elusimicrobia bacterium RIFOXYB2_FULL_50_12]